ncbi:MAG: LLM class F420-dependent oxidoreductase [Candidatus Tectomicrobia bacterium]|uniref:LLM class F420-dependent oxidoreductase n=1 Tax=Tectimicrobiota bacterium TaxID=2528274 RepID=A0A937W4P6_UNCTE|nr:LLM class F420-dependent oxidoreductase [Candidatus Tectomicrobia bacterium]
MQFGIGLPNLSYVDPTPTLISLAQAAQELAFDSIWVSDHVFMPYEYAPNYPYSTTGRLGLSATDHIFDPLTTLAFLAGQVSTPRLGVSVLIIPYRNPIVTAKMLVTLDVLSGGRVILGAGVGWMQEEFAALGALYEHRGQVTDEYIQIFRELCTAEKPVFEGKHYQIANIGFYPKPLQKPHPPVWIGGYSPAALRRAVRLGDGWHPSNLPPAALVEKKATLQRLCQEAGRDLASLSISTRVNNVAFGDSGDTTGRPSPLSGTAQQMIDAIKRYEDAGVSHIVLGIRGRDAAAMLTTARRFVDEVRPRI